MALRRTVLGLKSPGAVAAATFSLNSTSNILFLGFIPSASKTLSTLKVYAASVVGTLGASDLVCELWSMPTGALGSTTAPASLIESRNTVTATPAGAAVVEFTGFTSALTAGTMYALLFKNANGSPASNYCTLRYLSNLDEFPLGATSFGWVKRQSTDGGSSWTNNVIAAAGVRVTYSDGFTEGLPATNAGVTAVGDRIYGARELGCRYVMPAQVRLRVVGLETSYSVTGTPTGNLRGRIYSSGALVATSNAPPHRAATSSPMQLYFDAVQELAAGGTYDFMVGESANSDTSGNGLNLYELTVEDLDAARATLPFGGCSKVQFDGASTWVVTNTTGVLVALILDPVQPFATGGPGGGFF